MDVRNNFNLPNALTMFRIVLIPAIVAVLLTKFEYNEIVALIIFIVASITDWADGFIARKYSKVTVMGKLLDPVADKMLTSAVLISLVGLNPKLAWMVVIIIAREFATTGLRMIALTKNITIAASFMGKLKMSFTIGTIIALIIGEKLFDIWGYGHWGAIIGYIGLCITIVLGLISSVQYFSDFWSKIEELES